MSNQETQKSEFKSDNITVNVTRMPGCKIKLDIFVSPLGADAAYRKAIKTINKDVSIPGFRKGKAPDSMILQNYKKYVDQEWNDVLVNTAFQEALNLTKIYPFTKESIKRPQVKNSSPKEGAHIVVEFEAAPDVPSVNPSDLTIKVIERAPITQEDIDATIHDLRLRNSQWEDVTDRPVQEGDFVDLDIDAIDEPQRNICKDMRFEVAEGKMGGWMRKLVIGKNSGEVVEGVSEKEPEKPCEACNDPSHEHHHHHHPEFKPTTCRIFIKGIKTAKLPEINDELAQKAGVQDVEKLRTNVTAFLERQAEEKSKASFREQVEQQLIAKYQFDLPASFIDKDKEARLSFKISHLSDDEKHRQERLEELEKEAATEAEQACRLFFLTSKVAEESNLTVSSDEIVQEYMRESMIEDPAERIFDNRMDPKDIRTRLYTYLLEKKAKNYLAEKAAKI